MTARVCITNADAALRSLRFHRYGQSYYATGRKFTHCGLPINEWWGILSIRQDRAEAMGATPCRRCFREGTP